MRNIQAKFTELYSRHHKIILLLIALMVVFFRRPSQILYPYIWDEDGTVILKEYLNNGLFSIFNPVNGYYILSSRIINFLSYAISFWYYPEIVAFFANAFIITVVFAIAYSPTNLKYPWLCAVLALFVKTDAECFSTALYSFWWAGLLLILVTIWKDKCNLKLQVMYILIGGFSSPLICITSPILCVKAIIKRERKAICAAIISLIPFFVQAITIVMMTNKGDKFNHLNTKMIIIFFGRIINQFFGRYYIQGIQPNRLLSILAGLGLLSILIFAMVKMILIFFKENHRTKTRDIIRLLFNDKNLVYYVLFIWLWASIFMSVYRVPVETIHPFFAGPRYFFYPFIVISWMLVWILGELRVSSFSVENHFNKYFGELRLFAQIGIIVLLFSFLFDGTLPYMSRDHVRIDWRRELTNTMLSNEPYNLPIHYDGYTAPWSITVTAQQCQRMIENSLLFRNFNVKLINNGE